MTLSCVFLFSDSCSWVPCLSWTVKLPAVLQKNPSGPTNSIVFQHLFVFEPFPTITVCFWDSYFHTRTTEGLIWNYYGRFKHSLMLQKEKPCIKSRGVNYLKIVFLIWKSGYILLIFSSGKHVSIFCSLWRAVLNKKTWYLGKIRKIYISPFCSNVFTPNLLQSSILVSLCEL